MEKTKFGVSINIMAMIIYFLAAGYLFFSTSMIYPLIVAVAYVLVKEGKDLKAHALMATVLVVIFNVVEIVMSLIPGFISFLNFFVQFADVHIYDEFKITDFISLLINWAFQALLIILGFMALKGKKIKIFDKFID